MANKLYVKTWSFLRPSGYPLLREMLKEARMQVVLEHLASLALLRACGPAANCPKWEWGVRYRTVCYHISLGEDQILLWVLVKPLMGGVWWRRNCVQHSTNGVITLHLTSHMEENIDLTNVSLPACVWQCSSFLVKKLVVSLQGLICEVLATAKSHANYSGKGWFRSSGRSGTLNRVCFGVMTSMKTTSWSRLKKKKNRGFGHLFWGSVFLLEM